MPHPVAEPVIYHYIILAPTRSVALESFRSSQG